MEKTIFSINFTIKNLAAHAQATVGGEHVHPKRQTPINTPFLKIIYNLAKTQYSVLLFGLSPFILVTAALQKQPEITRQYFTATNPLPAPIAIIQTIAL